MHRLAAAVLVLTSAGLAWAGDPIPTQAAVPPATDDPGTSTAAPAPAAKPSPPVDEPPPSTSDVEGEPVRAMAASDYVLSSEAGISDVRSYAKDWLVAPPGYNIGGELRFITAATSPDGPRIRFTDFAILRFHSRITVSKRIELAGSIDLLSKQPDTRHDTILQGGTLGLKVATSRRTAIATAIAGGPTMGDDGFWGSAATGAVHRSRIEEFLAFQFGGGAAATALRQDDMDPRWQADLDFSSELVLHAPKGEVALWTGVDMAFPVVHSSGLEPSSRLDVTVGGVFSAVKDWDIYTAFTYRDRGSTDLPLTTLPIADGGFDQRQIVVGIARRFTARGQGTLWALATD